MARSISTDLLDRILRAVHWVERRIRSQPGRRGRWQGRGGGARVRWGKLDGVLAEGGTQTVSLWKATAGGWGGWDVDSTDDVTASCPPTCSGLPGPAVTGITTGIFVQVVWTSGVWIVAWPQAIRIMGLADAAVAAVDATFDIDNVTTMFGPLVVDSAADTITIQNTHSWAIDENGVVEAVWNGDAEQWEAVQADCP